LGELGAKRERREEKCEVAGGKISVMSEEKLKARVGCRIAWAWG
jgi:hypothetical protein